MKHNAKKFFENLEVEVSIKNRKGAKGKESIEKQNTKRVELS